MNLGLYFFLRDGRKALHAECLQFYSLYLKHSWWVSGHINAQNIWLWWKFQALKQKQTGFIVKNIFSESYLKSPSESLLKPTSLPESAVYYDLLVILCTLLAAKRLHEFYLGKWRFCASGGCFRAVAGAVLKGGCGNGGTEGERIFLGGRVKVKCITRGQPIGWHHPIALHRLHSAPQAEAYLAPFIMHGHHPPVHRPVMARSFRQLSPTLLFPLRGCTRLHNLDAARCFQSSSLIKNVTHWVSGGVLSKGGNGRCSSWDNGWTRGPKLPQLFL